MTPLRTAATLLLGVIALAALWPPIITATPYDRQFREFPNATPCRQFWLGTDELGRDRLARLLYGTRISLIAAPSAALLSTFLAALVGGVAGYARGWCDRSAGFLINLMLSLPSLFLMILVRAALPLNVPPSASIILTFGLIGALGWPSAAMVVRAAVIAGRESEAVILAAAGGVPNRRILLRHILPRLRPILTAKFCSSIPIFILAEANLGLLGLGIGEPLPSWGNLLRQLEHGFAQNNSVAWSPLALIVIVAGCFQILKPIARSAA